MAKKNLKCLQILIITSLIMTVENVSMFAITRNIKTKITKRLTECRSSVNRRRERCEENDIQTFEANVPWTRVAIWHLKRPNQPNLAFFKQFANYKLFGHLIIWPFFIFGDLATLPWTYFLAWKLNVPSITDKRCWELL
jgi:hypothetical protein